MPDKTSAAFTPHSLDALEARVAQDRQNLCVPAANWVSNHQVGEEQVLDVVVIGGGMCGLLAQHALISGGVRNIAQFDRSETGLDVDGHIRKYDGEPFMPHHIVDAVVAQLAGETDHSVPTQEIMV